ncbi:MAG: hypothetical protein Greene07144_810, partial [Parcubacteria group bacterium Greene0714_4]
MAQKTKKTLLHIFIPLFIFVAVFGSFAIIDIHAVDAQTQAEATAAVNATLAAGRPRGLVSATVETVQNSVASTVTHISLSALNFVLGALGTAVFALSGWILSAAGFVLGL